MMVKMLFQGIMPDLTHRNLWVEPGDLHFNQLPQVILLCPHV